MKKLYLFFLALTFFAFTNTYADGDKKAQAVAFIYHHFGEERYPSTNTRLEQFQAHLDYLQENNYNVWPLSKIVYYVKNKMTLPQKTVSLTIDDAYISVYTKAFPMLKKKRFPFTVFVNTNPIGKNAINYMTWDMMREMKPFGAEFANHSHTHPYLLPKEGEARYAWQERIRKELDSAQTKLQKELGYGTNENPKLLSYPFGEYTKETADFIQSLGYIGVSQTSGVISENSDLRALPRFPMSESFAGMEEFFVKLNMRDLPVERIEPFDTVPHSNPPLMRVKLKRAFKTLGCYTANGKRIDVRWISDKEFEVRASQSLAKPRDRYTCTAVDNEGQWYWYSHLWIIK